MISVIIPVWNTGATLRRCLDSVLRQTYADMQIICVDDGSTDDSLSILHQYAVADARITVAAQEHKGVACARNKGLALAAGEAVAFVDSDDEIAPEAFEKCMGCFTEDVDSVWFRTKADCEYDADLAMRVENYLNRCPQGKLRLDDDMLLWCSVQLTNKIFRRENIIEGKLSFPEDLHFEDEAFYYNYFSLYKNMYGMDDSLYVYHMNKNSIMGRKRGKKESLAGDCISIAKTIYDFWQKNGLLEGRERVFAVIMEKMVKNAVYFSPGFLQPQCLAEAIALLKEWQLPLTDGYLHDLAEGHLRVIVGVPGKAVSGQSSARLAKEKKAAASRIKALEAELKEAHAMLAQREANVAALKQKIIRKKQKVATQKARIARLEARLAAAQKRTAQLKSSASWRIGRAATWIFRLAGRLLRTGR